MCQGNIFAQRRYLPEEAVKGLLCLNKVIQSYKYLLERTRYDQSIFFSTIINNPLSPFSLSVSRYWMRVNPFNY